LGSKHADIQYEVIAVNDGSSDRTVERIKNFQEKESRLKLINFEYNKGRGSAMRAGLAMATSEYLLFLDADLSYDVDHITDVINYFKSSPQTDALIISPYMKGGISKNIPLARLLLSKMANWILADFFSSEISTVTSMVRAYRTKILQGILLVESGKELHLEILRKLYLVGANIAEIPGRLIWKEKKSRNARISKKKIAISAKKHILYGFLSRPTKFLGKLAFFVLLISLWEMFNLLRNFWSYYSPQGDWIGQDLWAGLSQTFYHSPHTVVISVVGLIISVQVFSYLALFSILNMQHEEQLRHILKMYKDQQEK